MAPLNGYLLLQIDFCFAFTKVYLAVLSQVFKDFINTFLT